MGDMFDRGMLSGEALRLLDVLLEHANSAGRAQVPSTVLLKGSGLTQGGLVRARAELTRSGLMRVEPGFSRSGLRGANIYVLNLPTPRTPSTSASGGESGRIQTGKLVLPAHPDSEPLPAPSGRHRTTRKGLWSRIFGGPESS